MDAFGANRSNYVPIIARLPPVDLVSVVVHSLKRLSDGDGDDVADDGHEEALDGKVPAIAREAAHTIHLQKAESQIPNKDEIRRILTLWCHTCTRQT